MTTWIFVLSQVKFRKATPTLNFKLW